MQSSSLNSTPSAPGPPIHELNTGERRWLAELYEANYRPVVRLCTSLLHNGEDAADAAQDVFLVVFKGLAKFRGESRVSTWIYRITIRWTCRRTRAWCS